MKEGTYADITYSATEIVTGKDAKMLRAGTTTNMHEPASTSAYSIILQTITLK